MYPTAEQEPQPGAVNSTAPNVVPEFEHTEQVPAVAPPLVCT
jgi:hypothetical protein